MKPGSSSICRKLLPVLVLAAAAVAQTAGDRRFEEIKARHDRGEKITAEEREFASRTTERRSQEAAAKRFADYEKEHPARQSVGLAPLPDPEGSFGKAAIFSNGKDTTVGHWEMAGLITMNADDMEAAELLLEANDFFGYLNMAGAPPKEAFN
jgi:hypothetical protein